MARLSIDVTVDGQAAATCLANVSRPDLVAAGAATSAHHGFLVGLAPELVLRMQRGKHTIGVAASDGAVSWALGNSPRCLCDFVPCAC